LNPAVAGLGIAVQGFENAEGGLLRDKADF
jgi:hypothetical protein